jgi:uncharacterized GH25 family protein
LGLKNKNMKKLIFTVVFILVATLQSFAHYLWIETSATGVLNEEQEIRVYFGEYTSGLIEKVDKEAYQNVNDFILWVMDASGNKTELKVIAKEDYYLTKFKSNGTYTVLLDNNNIDVVDYTQYDFGVLKTHYHAVTKIQVGKKTNETTAANKDGITVKDVSATNEKIELQVLYKDKTLKDIQVKIFVADQWSKTLETEENGLVSFKLPWEAKYIVETTIKEEVSGVYKDVKYEFIWHCATYCIQ